MKFQLNNLHVDITKLLNDVRGPKGTAALTEEFQRISGELKKLRKEVEPKAKAQLKKAEAKYGQLLKRLHAVQKDLDKEVKSGITIVRKQAKGVKAAFTKKRAGPARKTAAQKTNKRTSKKTSKKA